MNRAFKRRRGFPRMQTVCVLACFSLSKGPRGGVVGSRLSGTLRQKANPQHLIFDISNPADELFVVNKFLETHICGDMSLPNWSTWIESTVHRWQSNRDSIRNGVTARTCEIRQE